MASSSLPFKPGHFITYLLTHPSIQAVWTSHIHHPFVLGLGNGTLPAAKFKTYLIQDYLFLTSYARICCLSASLAPTLPDVFTQAEYALSVRTEKELHVSYCLQHFGITEAEMAAAKPHPACTAYVDFLREIGERGDWLALQVALSPCMEGYRVVGEFLATWEGSVKGEEGNRYWGWVEQYAGKEYGEAVRGAGELLERYVAGESAERVEGLVGVFRRAAELEIGFWDMGLEGGMEDQGPVA